MDLGANEWTTFWKVTFPLILPGVIAAALLAFSLSIDDYVITAFTSGQTEHVPAVHLRLAAARHPGPGQRHRHDHLRDRGRARAVRPRCRQRPDPVEAAPRPSQRSTAHDQTDPTPALQRSHCPTARSSRRLGRYTDLVIDRGEGSWLITRDGERYLDYTSGIGVTNTGHAHPRVAAAIAAQAPAAAPRPAEHRLPRAGPAAPRAAAEPAARRPWGAFLSNSGAEAIEASVKLARVATGRPAIVAFRYGFHGRTAQAMALTTRQASIRAASSRCPAPSTTPTYPYCYRAAGGPHDPSACTCDWEERLDLLFAPGRRPGAGRRDHHRAGHRRGRLHRAAAGLPAAPARDRAPARHPARRRRGPDRLRAHRSSCSRSSTGASSRTSSSSPRASRRACRCRASWRAASCSPRGRRARTAAPTAATSSPARLRSRRSTSSRTRGWSQNARRARRAAARRAAAARSARYPQSATCAVSGCMVAIELVKPGEGDGRVPDPRPHKRVLAEALARQADAAVRRAVRATSSRIIPPLVTTADEVDLALTILDESLAAAGA